MDRGVSLLVLAVLVAMSGAGPLATHIFLPALPAIQKSFGVSPGVAQLTLSLSLVSMAIATLFYGPLSDRFGRRPALLAGMAVFLAGSAMCVIAPTIGWLVAGRIVQAAGGAAGLVVTRAIISDAYPQERVASMMGYLIMAMVLSTIIAPTLGGILSDLVGWRAIFGLVTAAALIIVVVGYFLLVETSAARAPGMDIFAMFSEFRRFMTSATFLLYTLQGAFSMSIFFAFIAGGPFVVVGVMGRPATEYGLYFIMLSAGFVGGTYITGRFSERLGINRMIAAGSSIALVSTLVMLAFTAAGMWVPLALFGPGMIAGFANGFTIPNSQAGALRFDPAAAGTASGLIGFTQMLIAAAVAQIVGVFQGDTPYPMVIAMVVCATLSFGVMLRLRVVGARAGWLDR